MIQYIDSSSKSGIEIGKQMSEKICVGIVITANKDKFIYKIPEMPDTVNIVFFNNQITISGKNIEDFKDFFLWLQFVELMYATHFEMWLWDRNNWEPIRIRDEQSITETYDELMKNVSN